MFTRIANVHWSVNDQVAEDEAGAGTRDNSTACTDPKLNGLSAFIPGNEAQRQTASRVDRHEPEEELPQHNHF